MLCYKNSKEQEQSMVWLWLEELQWSHLFFADNCYLFCWVTLSESSLLKKVLDEFTKASGQAVNYNKSTITFSKSVEGNSKELVSEILGMAQGNLNGNYLGLPSLIGRNK